MKTVQLKRIFYQLLFTYVTLFVTGTSHGFTSHNTSITRQFSATHVSVSSKITVVVSFTNLTTAPIRGWYFLENIPNGLTASPVSFTVNGISVNNYLFETGLLSDVIPQGVPHRWILEQPVDFVENNPILYNTTVVITYDLQSNTEGPFLLNDFSWVGFFENALPEQMIFWGHSEYSDSQEISFNNTPPVANNDSFFVLEDSTTTMSLLTNDFDSEDNINPTSIQIITGPGNGILAISTLGEVVYSPNSNFFGIDTFNYSVSDYALANSNSGQVTVNVENVNDPPVAFAGVNQSVSAGEEVLLNASGSYDIDDSVVSYLWAQISGTSVNLLPPDDSSLSIMAPPSLWEDQFLEFQLTVTDPSGFSNSDSTQVTVYGNNNFEFEHDDDLDGLDLALFIESYQQNLIWADLDNNGTVAERDVELFSSGFGDSSKSFMPQQVVSFIWDSPTDSDIIGFKMYGNDSLICVENNPLARKKSCLVNTNGTPFIFTMTAIDSNGNDSALSNNLQYIPF